MYVEENEIELNPYKWLTLPKRNLNIEKEKYKEIINLVSTIVEKTINFQRFPDELALKVIPDLFFQDVKIGEFNFLMLFLKTIINFS